jgi:hypothetical protein
MDNCCRSGTAENQKVKGELNKMQCSICAALLIQPPVRLHAHSESENVEMYVKPIV